MKRDIEMPRCRTCGGFVTQNYVQVFARSGMTTVHVCPRCEDDAYDEAERRDARW